MMNFYESIATYYDYIFPLTKEKLNLITSLVNNPPKTLLDVACGTGIYSTWFDTYGIDLDLSMINKAKQKALEEHLNCKFYQGNMLQLNDIINNSFDLIFCIGNSLVHLKNNNEIIHFIKSVYKLLNDNGSMLIQIINFNRIMEKKISQLPTIKNHSIGLMFERNYHHVEKTNKIQFNTVLTVNDKKIENNIPLIPILYEELLSIIKNCGFTNVKTYGDFKFNEYIPSESYQLIIIAKK